MLDLPEGSAHAGGAQISVFPLTVHRVFHSRAVGPITSDRVKVKVVNSGTTTIRHQRGALNLGSGQVALFPPGHWYSGDPVGLVVTTTVYIDAELLQGQVHWFPESSAPALLLSRNPRRSDPIVLDLPPRALSRLNTSFRLLLESQKCRAPALRQLSLIAELFDVLTATPHTPRNETVHHAVWLVLEHLDHQWTINTLASAVSISKSQLSRLFREHLRISPAEFLRTERAHRMAELLLADPGSVESIAQQVGWPDLSHASRAFRHVHGFSPQRYRQAHGTQQVEKHPNNSRGLSQLTEGRKQVPT